jgi:probable aminopeptidase NPEPL1
MPTKTHIVLSAELPSDIPNTVVVIGRKAQLEGSELAGILGVCEKAWAAMLERTKPGDSGAAATTWVCDRKVSLAVLPEVCSRANSPSRAWAIPKLAAAAKGTHDALIIAVCDDVAHIAATCLSISRALPLYSSKSGKNGEQTVTLVPMGAKKGDLGDIGAAIEGVRAAAELVDMPTAELHTDEFAARAKALCKEVGASFDIIQGTELDAQGFGGLWGVGKAATHLPAMAIMTYEPKGTATHHVAWVGKGIVYDTGGLSIKGKTGMPGMKGDMGGAAAVFGAFLASAKQGVGHKITAVLCLAENAVGPDSVRPDDILTMKSGKTVEINNTDAEGRLVLADGVAWVAAETDATLIIDLATLTGAALVTAGKVHAAIYTNDEGIEQAAVVAGRAIGEPVYPLLYTPELFRKEFKSPVADMRNSVKSRANAQSSCAGQFIANHLPEDAPSWLHVDIAGPAWDANNRGTGYGVGLLLELCASLG